MTYQVGGFTARGMHLPAGSLTTPSGLIFPVCHPPRWACTVAAMEVGNCCGYRSSAPCSLRRACCCL